MKIHTEGMKMIPEIIYVTGGASQNNVILQHYLTFSNQMCKGLKLVVLLLGGAIRAAQHSLNLSLKTLEEAFCVNYTELIKPNKS